MSFLKKWIDSFKSGSKRVAVFVDGPNLLRKELGIDVDLIRRIPEIWFY